MNGLAYFASPVGDLLIESEDDGITTINFLKTSRVEERRTPVIDQCIRELEEYFFEGRKFFTFELKLIGSDFQTRVWNELLTIPYGRTISYLDLALQLGDPNTVRAVGLANGQNPVAIVVPCHRVIGKNGDLIGYGGGLDKKEWLLHHEGAFSQQLKLF
ncbi:MAG TPA: methylated-DNA--[protein]-cysteine S-methyltransferase [Chryseosolibacter sp.]|nr:methylated-DNA--[protein]-cysteine S-methyltransferase [Chryseosolibacter sp.]